MATTNSSVIRAIAFREGEAWVAQCIDHDISSQGKTFPDAMRRLTAAVNAECEYTLEKHGEEFAGIDPAPEKFEQMFIDAEQSLQADNMEWRIAA
ncbi:MAG: hypothetical protein QOG13_1607 [Sphingomonadales bacterium]|jgi:predicted RNase H-like HicB family nuclease|nr:hypothetical protein [Sphingomonadales bacterium]